jgi:hypothetical protein
VEDKADFLLLYGINPTLPCCTTTWKSALNNLRLIIQSYIFYCLIQPWLQVFKIPGMKRCFLKLIDLMNDFRASPISLPVAC